ncbi:predicted protein [Lichtheimia corymbifera JMRC:FSU:9682]|uniref:Uncharacterized protein n=1 Tax=Lichtheimia corymbifera JMRC:FSU:9682 TaxID=1263082 RepID=A0A068RFU2_9FUNG|nr:predicted protein [Lichtheimia corymbifera JMRC:FSU:9682]
MSCATTLIQQHYTHHLNSTFGGDIPLCVYSFHGQNALNIPPRATSGDSPHHTFNILLAALITIRGLISTKSCQQYQYTQCKEHCPLLLHGSRSFILLWRCLLKIEEWLDQSPHTNLIPHS